MDRKWKIGLSRVIGPGGGREEGKEGTEREGGSGRGGVGAKSA